MSKWRKVFFRITVADRAKAEIEQHKRDFYDQSRVAAIAVANMNYHVSEVSRLTHILNLTKDEKSVDNATPEVYSLKVELPDTSN